MAITRHVASVSLPVAMLADLRAEAARRDVSLSQVIREYVRSGQQHGAQQGELDLVREEGTNGH